MFHSYVSLPEGKMIHISISMLNPSMDICYDICSLFVNQTPFLPFFSGPGFENSTWLKKKLGKLPSSDVLEANGNFM